MNPVLVGLVLLLTVTAAMAFGIVLGYGLFTGILHLMGRHERLTPAAPKLAPGSVSSGGD